MKPKKLSVKLLWKQFEDLLFPRLRLSITDRAVYSHLIRHTRLEGKLQLHCSMPWIARGIGVSTGPVRESVRRLIVLGALRLIQRSKTGHVIEVRLPDEIRPAPPGAIAVGDPVNASPSANLEEIDFLKTRTRASPSISANAVTVFIACAARTRASNAWTTSCPASRRRATPTATWFPVVWNAIR